MPKASREWRTESAMLAGAGTMAVLPITYVEHAEESKDTH